MQINLIAIGQKMPDWVTQGADEFIKRMPPECRINIIEIPAGKRGKSSDITRIIQQEGEKMLAAIPKNNRVLAMDVKGKQWSTEDLADEMRDWMQGGQDISLLIGGPEGLAPACREHAQGFWSLSRMTLPHPLVRVVLVEQLYRAMSIIKNHPYHK